MIVSVIGIGGFSIVYKAMDTVLMREVAIKEYFPGGIALRDSDGSVHSLSREVATFKKGIESFLKEGKLLAQFDHPALVRVYRFWEERGTAYLAMRLYDGVTLRDAVKASTWSVNEQSLPALLLPICEALQVLHAARCYHRDVAPDNILLGENNWPVLLDFGAARKAIEGTQVFTAILKPGYAPIEQYGDGELKQGPWTDIYALAGVVHFTLSGDPPPTAINRMMRDSMPRPRDAFADRLPKRWLDALEKSLAVKPESRPQSVAEFVSLMGWDEMSAPVVDVATHLVRADLPPTVLLDAAPPPPVATAKTEAQSLDDERTVVAPRMLLPQPEPAIAPAPAMAWVAQPVAETEHRVEAAPKRPGKGLALAAGVILLAAMLWAWSALAPHGTADSASPQPASGAQQSPVPAAAPQTPAVVPPGADLPPVSPANDTSSSAKTSLPEGALAAPKSVVAEPETRPTQPPAMTASETEALPAPVRKLEARVSTRPPRADPERTEPREARRPARCPGLIERWQLGAALSDEEQRFYTEKCK